MLRCRRTGEAEPGLAGNFLTAAVFLLGGEKCGYRRIRLGDFRSARGGLVAEPLGRNAAI